MRDLSGYQAVILCEGRDDYDFARGYLEKIGLNLRRCQPRVSPAGKRAGSAWVRERFAEELKAWRSKRSRMNLVLVAMIDGDGRTPEERKRELETSEEMSKRGLQPRQPKEEVLIIVPMRHIEAWFEFVVSGTCDESEKTKYKNKYRKSKRPTKWGGMLADKCREVAFRPGNDWPEAMRDGCDELNRLS